MKLSYACKCLAALSLSLTMTACADSSVSYPSSFSYDQMTYDGTEFTGLPMTSNMPNAGTATYQGKMRANIKDDYRDGTVTITANFSAASANVATSTDFSGSATGDGVIITNNDTSISGNSFFEINTQSGDSVSGNFYGNNAQMAAGTIRQGTATDNVMTGYFIAAQ